MTRGTCLAPGRASSWLVIDSKRGMLNHPGLFCLGCRYLDRDELVVAFGIFGAEQGQLLTAGQQDEAFTVLDKDLDGEISFGEFQAWWKSMEAEQCDHTCNSCSQMTACISFRGAP